MTLTFERLAEKLPAGVVEFVGNNQVKLNFSLLTGDEDLTLDSSLIEGVIQFLQGLAKLTDAINEERAKLNPPLEPIDFVSQQLIGTPQRPKFQFIVEVAVDTSAFTSNLVDPTQQ